MTFQFVLHSNFNDFCIWAVQFEWLSNFCDIPRWVTFKFEWCSNFDEFLIWGKFQFEWYFHLSDSLILVTFKFKWHSNLSDIQIWVTFQFEWHSLFEWHSNLSDIPRVCLLRETMEFCWMTSRLQNPLAVCLFTNIFNFGWQ